MPADEKDSAATNRLLDLLRSQQTGKSTTEGNASGTVDANTPPDQSDSSKKKKPESPAISSSIVPETIVDEAPPVEEKSASSSSDEIRAKLGKLTAKKTEAPPAEEPIQDEVIAPEAVPQGIAADLMDTPQGLETEPVVDPEKIATPPDDIEVDEKSQLIDPTYFQIHQDVPKPNKFIDLLFEFSNWAFGVRKKITFQCTPESIRVLKTVSTGNRNVVESMDIYPLPYELEDQKITHRDDLLAYILDTFDAKLWKKDTMFRMYSSFIETHTKIFKAPPVKGKEIAELITWTAKKNLPFSSENINIDHMVLDSEKGELKKNIIIGVGNNESITFMSDLFKKKKFDLQNVTTIPFIDWETFKHCYPDRLRGCIAIVHMNQNETTITMVKSGRMEFTREMAVGVKDYHKALIQRVMVGNDAVNITEEMATEYLMQYGIPIDTDQDIPETGISLYKIHIFLRPIVERMTSEINRSLDYFRKQVADVECQEIYLTGPGAAIPNLVEVFATQLERTTEHLNPLRQGDFEFSDQLELDHQLLPIFATNFGLALKTSAGINLLPIARKQHFQFKVFNKLSIFLTIILIPIYLLLGYFAYVEENGLEDQVSNMNRQWQKLSEQSQEYFIMLDDLEFLGNYWGFLENDDINSENQIKLLKLISSEIPDNIKVTSLVFRPASSKEAGSVIKQAAHVDRIALSGIVNAHAGIADIQLTNFIMRLESLNMFTSIDREGSPSSDDSRLLFTLKIGIGVK
ncbi:MAG: pilus assembly protein PilM [Candidatus Marinimicrobia bacterium]|nr:pilus assembly protein PilM [Candidatus Neomarinimicrobiota bacterium]MBT3824093.1 pilus assembly protein PilM [Candidatus Neomarinimicrobiota bacterium]MBT4035767.1 pilus assembly protein PilM [Candidatus Neomarinimicrobiota bacterium]MBT4294951.1 pilus assembly protein PilM [Candidatus Neomarinimicrobiota bacterium]MBT4480535.1 pilus assembly protein PilM [Candidatus Neomarinimicrobiota bacterium]